MTYYINPLWFYLINVIDKINNLSVVLVGLSIALLVVLGMMFLGFYENDYNEKCEEDIKTLNSFKKHIKRLILVTILSTLACVFIPDKQTCEEMMIASVVTHENVDAVKGDVKELIDYVSDKVEQTESENN